MNILNHNQLMTPMLIEKFGAIYVETKAVKEDNDLYARTSIIKQKSTDKKLLSAKIKVQKNAVPASLIEKLKSTNNPLGQLLQDYKMDVKIENLRLFQIIDQQTNKQSYGRKVEIVNAISQALICSVEEVLAD